MTASIQIMSHLFFHTRATTEASLTEASLTDPTEDDALSNRPVSHREQVAIAIEVTNLRRERDEARRERDEARREQDAALQNWSRERLSVNAARGNNSTCRAMTGLSWVVFDCLHCYLVQLIKSPRKVFLLSTASYARIHKLLC